MSDAIKEVVLEGKWRCEHQDDFSKEICDYENRGPDLSCKKCGHARPEGVKFYLTDDARVVTDQKEIEQALAGPDWKCGSCNFDNRSTDLRCQHCKELRNERMEEMLGMGGNLRTGEYDHSQTRKEARQREPGKESSFFVFPAPSLIPKILTVVGSVLIAVLFIWLLWYLFFDTKEVLVKVTGFFWQREIGIETEKLVDKEGWDMPVGAIYISQEDRVHHYVDGEIDYYEPGEPIYDMVQDGEEEVDCGTEDKGNGYFVQKKCNQPKMVQKQVGTTDPKPVYKKVPIKQPWFHYRVYEWLHTRTETASNYDKNPRWPTYETGYRERVSGKTEAYQIFFNSVDKINGEIKKFNYPTDFRFWHSAEQEQIFTAKVNRIGIIMSLGPVARLE